MKFTLAEKVEMTQLWDADGNVHAVTVLKAPGVVVSGILTKEKNGYEAIQVSMPKTKNTEYIKEFRTFAGDLQKGASIKCDIFQVGDTVEVSSTSKSKGFQGVVKRHGFKGGWDQHGQKHSHREAGSIGGGARAGGRVAKGMRMPGRMGGDRVTVKNLKIMGVDAENGVLFIKGAVPGRRGTLVEVVAK